MNKKIALTGNPNAGKTSIFNLITGASQKVGNWGGVTVEIKEGSAHVGDEIVSIIDLPGTYSLSACSQDEEVARAYLEKEKPDAVIDVIDATNLERHLYLTVQLVEMGIRPIIALNMWDEVLAKGIKIDIPLLSHLLGLSIVSTDGRRGQGISDLLSKAVGSTSKGDESIESKIQIKLPMEIEKSAAEISALLDNSMSDRQKHWTAVQLLEHDRMAEDFTKARSNGQAILDMRDTQEKKLTAILGDSPQAYIAEARYGFIAGAVKEAVSVEVHANRIEISEKIDSVLTHRFFAYPLFLLFMWILFQATFKLGNYPMGWIESLFALLHSAVSQALPQGIVRSLLTDGIISGVGGVIVFLPNILILFLGISIMEDTGYMARAAFIMDKLMHRIGLHGKSFIPVIMGLGCSVPAIMAARTLESKQDRIKTILLTPLISCSARLPVFVLFAGALFPNQAGNIVFLFQIVFGFAAFALMALLFKHTLFRNKEEYPFVMELPPYRMPTGRSILIHMWQKTEHYLKKMGGVVLLFSVILWWAGAYPKSTSIEKLYNERIAAVSAADISVQQKQQETNLLLRQERAAIMEQTYIGRIGKAIEPAVKTFGTDWRGAVSLVTGFVAKEIVVGSMGVLYAVTDDSHEEKGSLRQQLRLHFTPLSAFCFMLFVLLYTPCMVALITAIRELKNWKWSVFSVAYQLALAWIASTAVYQVGRAVGLQ